jgi:Mg2+ and Co2+ transporter CorA
MVNCQLYKYNNTFYSFKKESADFFANNFTQNEIDTDHTCWLNYHGLSERQNIELLCDNIKIDTLCVESIFTETRRAKVEEYDDYMFFSIKSALSSDDETNLLQWAVFQYALQKKKYVEELKDTDEFKVVKSYEEQFNNYGTELRKLCNYIQNLPLLNFNDPSIITKTKLEQMINLKIEQYNFFF